MRKLLCACGCGDRVTQKVERRHINALAPALLASEVLVTNQRLKTHKKRSQAIPFPTPFPQQLTMQNISQIDGDFDMDHGGPSGLTYNDDDISLNSLTMMGQDPDDEVNVYGQSKLHRSGQIQQSKSLRNHSEVDEGSYMAHDYAGLSRSGQHLTNDDAVLPDSPSEDFDMDLAGPSSLTGTNDAVMGKNIDAEVYGLSKLRRSGRIANRVEKIHQQRWGSNGIALFVNDKEQSDEDEDDIEDDEPSSVFDVDADEGLEGDDEDNELIAAQGQEGISVWDILGEGFLKEASQLGICHSGIIFNKISNSCSRGKASG